MVYLGAILRCTQNKSKFLLKFKKHKKKSFHNFIAPWGICLLYPQIYKFTRGNFWFLDVKKNVIIWTYPFHPYVGGFTIYIFYWKCLKYRAVLTGIQTVNCKKR